MKRKLHSVGTLVGLSALVACTFGGAKKGEKKDDKAKDKPSLAVEGQKSLAEGVAPNPSEVTIRGVTYAGSGCPANSVVGTVSVDAKALTLVFDRFDATVDPF